MVARSFFAFDSEAITVAPGSPSLTVGSSIINNSDTPNGTIFTYAGGNGRTITIDDRNGGGNSNIFADDDRSNHRVLNGQGFVANNQQVEAESLIFLRQLDGSGNQIGPTITITVFSQGGNTSDVWGFSTNTALIPGARYVKTGGSNTGTSPYSSFITCFAEGTMIRCGAVDLPVEKIRAGTLVWTESAGLRPVRWTGRREVDAMGDYAPIRFAPGVLGNRSMVEVSPQHRVLICSPMAELYFGTSRVLVAAKHLLGLSGVSVAPRASVAYHHFMFDRHEIVEADGFLSESFYPGDTSLAGIDRNALTEILELFPELATGEAAYGETAELVIRGREAQALLSSGVLA
jgi:hypothetical protein